MTTSCKGCGKEFKHKFYHQIYCSKNCFSNKPSRALPKVIKNCSICGKNFLIKRSDIQRKYCGLICGYEANKIAGYDRKKYKAEWAKNNREKTRAAGRKYYQYHKEKIKNYAIKYKEHRAKLVLPTYIFKIKEEVFSHYSNGEPECKCCGEKIIYFLTIDHVNGDGAEDRRKNGRGGYTQYKWLKDNNYPLGFQVLCYNCNCGKRDKKFCPHKLLEENYANIR